ncbi:PEGA domain-containing protein [Candidatus Saccharibacteria bacterium]|nr:PEGA domain-containing protein [Candidatus Saccharibacteria bacterium]
MKRLTANQRIKLAVAAFLGLVVLAIIFTAVIYVSRIGKVAVITKYAPYNASVYLNGSEINNNATNFLTPGTYELTVNLEHFVTNTETITITEDTEYILGSLIFADEEGQVITAERKKDFLEVEGIFGKLLTNAGNKIRQEYPILDFLPINNAFYSISFAYKDDGSPKITVQAQPTMVDVAVRKMLSFPDITLTDYDITFTTPNPFTSPAPNNISDPFTFIRASFPNIINHYQFGPGRNAGEYYLTTIYTYNFTSDDSYAHFKVILRKTGDSWTFAATPQLLFTTKNAPSIPVEILDYANRL